MGKKDIKRNRLAGKYQTVNNRLLTNTLALNNLWPFGSEHKMEEKHKLENKMDVGRCGLIINLKMMLGHVLFYKPTSHPQFGRRVL